MEELEQNNNQPAQTIEEQAKSDIVVENRATVEEDISDTNDVTDNNYSPEDNSEEELVDIYEPEKEEMEKRKRNVVVEKEIKLNLR